MTGCVLFIKDWLIQIFPQETKNEIKYPNYIFVRTVQLQCLTLFCVLEDMFTLFSVTNLYWWVIM